MDLPGLLCDAQLRQRRSDRVEGGDHLVRRRQHVEVVRTARTPRQHRRRRIRVSTVIPALSVPNSWQTCPEKIRSITVQAANRPPKAPSIVTSAKTAGGFALSNPTGLINLGQIAEPEQGLPPAASDQNMRACGKSEADPYSSHRSGWWGRAGRSGDLESVSGNSSDGSGRRTSLETSLGRCPVSCGDFERLCHVAANFQI